MATTKYQREEKEFFAALGYAITRWSHVDAELFELTHFCLGGRQERTAVIFYRSPNINDHLELTNRLMRLSLSKANEMAWDAICKEIRQLLPFRNEITHNTPLQRIVVRFMDNGPPDISRQSWESQAHHSKWLYRKKPSPSSARQEDIRDHLDAVKKLLRRMSSFRGSLPARPKR